MLLFWNRRMLLLEGRINIFKTLAISKIVYLPFLTFIPNSLIEELPKILKMFIWHSSLFNNFENGGLKHVDISSKTINLQCSRFRKLCDENFHEWKITPSHLINKYFGKSFKSHLCLSFNRKYMGYLLLGKKKWKKQTMLIIYHSQITTLLKRTH